MTTRRTWWPGLSGVRGGPAGHGGGEVLGQPIGLVRLQRCGGDANTWRGPVAEALARADRPAPFCERLNDRRFLLDRNPHAEAGPAVRGDAPFGERGDEGGTARGIPSARRAPAA